MDVTSIQPSERPGRPASRRPRSSEPLEQHIYQDENQFHMQVKLSFQTSDPNVGAVLPIDVVKGRLEELWLGLPDDHRVAAGRVLESGREKSCVVRLKCALKGLRD